MKQTIKTVNLNRAAAIRERIMRLTRLTDEQLNHLIFELAVDYMKGLGMSEQWLAVWLREPIFWAWWRQQWTLVDEIFWYKYSINLEREPVVGELRMRYEHMHRSIDRFPDDVVYEQIHSSYQEMSHQIIRKVTSKHENQ